MDKTQTSPLPCWRKPWTCCWLTRQWWAVYLFCKTKETPRRRPKLNRPGLSYQQSFISHQRWASSGLRTAFNFRVCGDLLALLLLDLDFATYQIWLTTERIQTFWYSLFVLKKVIMSKRGCHSLLSWVTLCAAFLVPYQLPNTCFSDLPACGRSYFLLCLCQ